MEHNKFLKVSIKNRTGFYFDNLTKFEDFDFDDILSDEKSYKTLIGAKPLCTRLDQIDSFIRAYNGSRYFFNGSSTVWLLEIWFYLW